MLATTTQMLIGRMTHTLAHIPYLQAKSKLLLREVERVPELVPVLFIGWPTDQRILHTSSFLNGSKTLLIDSKLGVECTEPPPV
jgi:hypothetical protein